ncbi:MAG: ROK family protein [Patescibacteria group bacterium]|jgi:N-acetylglucosamine kinase-like BadF-type ATPase
MWYVGIDIGGTNIDCVAVDETGAQFEMHKIRPVNQPSTEVALEVLEALLKSIPASKKQLKTVAIGWKHGRNKQKVIEITRVFAKKGIRVETFWDAETAFTGAIPGKQGILVLSGTGSCVYGKTKNSKVISSGGWSPLFGDPGSAFAIGQQAVVTALRCLDGSCDKTDLVKQIPDHIKMSLDDLIVMADANLPGSVPIIASIAKLVFRLADEGDSESIRIRTEAISHLCERIDSVIQQWPKDNPLTISYAGQVMLSQPQFRQAIQGNLTKMGHKTTWHEPVFRPPFGAILLAYPKLLPVLEKASQSLDWHHADVD